MKLKNITSKFNGKYLNLLEALYVDEKTGHEKIYEIASRYDDFQLNENNFGERLRTTHVPDGVGIIALKRVNNIEYILLQKEFRLACGEYVYNFPGGLVDYGETIEETAKRELLEETGLHLDNIIYILPQAYTAVGISNERVSTVICTASGTIVNSKDIDEDVEANWYTKGQVNELLMSSAPMSLRTQSFLYMWVNKGMLK